MFEKNYLALEDVEKKVPEDYKDHVWVLRIRGHKWMSELKRHRYALFDLHNGISVIEADSKPELIVKMIVYGFVLESKDDIKVERYRLPKFDSHWTDIYLNGLKLKGI